MTKIVAFSGRKQSGKSTSGDFVTNILNELKPNLSHKIYSFADPLKEDICMNILGLTHAQCYGSDEDKNTMTDLSWQNEQLTARRAMEVIGTDIFRKIKNSVWVDATMQKIARENVDIAIIVDCRFPNEADAILDHSGYVLRLTLDPFHSDSNSETALDPEYYNWAKFSDIIRNEDCSINEKNQHIISFLRSTGIL